jgi:asparagine synthase (glutamine-hydrolysing)
MWHSIEARVPFLHKSFFEYVALLPLDRKLRNGWTKYSFRAAMKGILPEKIRLRRSKIGFETPQKMWIEKELRNELKEFFSDPNLKAIHYYNAGSLRDLLNRDALTNDETSFIWRVLNLELWYRAFFAEKLSSRRIIHFNKMKEGTCNISKGL